MADARPRPSNPFCCAALTARVFPSRELLRLEVIRTGASAQVALTGDQGWLVERNAIYQERRDIILKELAAAGLTARVPRATLYVWARIPDGFTSAQFADRLLTEQAVSVAPGSAFGAQGEGYVRISLGMATERVHEAMDRLRQHAF